MSRLAMFRTLVLVSAMLCDSAAIQSQLPKGYRVGAPVALPDSLVEVFAGGRFRASIVRRARTAGERALIEIAEGLYPDKAALLSAARDAEHRAVLASLATGVESRASRYPLRAAGSPEDRWWFDTFDGTFTPFAVTGSAVAYYRGRIEDLAAGKGQFVYRPGDKPDRGTLTYVASVRRSTRPGTTHVVELRLSWDYWCGDLCAMEFRHSRTVYFDGNGAVVRIDGDGRPEVDVS